MAEYIDIGVNLTGSSFSDDVEDVISRAVDAGVRRMIVTGTDESHSEAALALCERFPGTLYATAGVHPHHADAYTEHSEHLIRDLCRHDSVVAVGECGLDYNRNYSTPASQRTAFESQLELAAGTGKLYAQPGKGEQVVYLDGEAVLAPTELRPGDRVRIGSLELQLSRVSKEE